MNWLLLSYFEPESKADWVSNHDEVANCPPKLDTAAKSKPKLTGRTDENAPIAGK